MRSDIFDKLRTEITEERKLRHDLIMRKFAFLTAFMGTGAINLLSKPQTFIDLHLLLFLVPFVAIAFDIYIFLEDYRIKRAGEFIKRLKEIPELDASSSLESVWEEFVSANPNKGSTYAFFGVTILYTVASLMLLATFKHDWRLLAGWIALAVILESVILTRHKKLRADLENSDFDLIGALRRSETAERLSDSDR
jgi:hypothetical protein